LRDFSVAVFPAKNGLVAVKLAKRPSASKDTVTELIRVLAYPRFKLSKSEQDLLLADFLPYAETVEIGQVSDDLIQIRSSGPKVFNPCRSRPGGSIDNRGCRHF
jgi:hypothetical protein